jgi:3-hydroxyisobutyrate dehydrogenase
MIPTSKHVQSVYVGGGGANNSILSALKSNKLSEEEVKSTLCMDESTIEMAASKAVSEEIERAGARCMDAPVSGGG